MRLDHIAYRVSNRKKTAEFIKKTFGYTEGTEFDVKFDDDSSAKCVVLVPPERTIDASGGPMSHVERPWILPAFDKTEYHMAPEIFISQGTPDSVVGKWVKKKGGGGGIHHMAYLVTDIEQSVGDWTDAGVKFLTEKVIDCPDDNLRQIFTKPLKELGGVIIELIERGEHGFCESSVKDLMESTEGV